MATMKETKGKSKCSRLIVRFRIFLSMSTMQGKEGPKAMTFNFKLSLISASLNLGSSI